MRNRKPRRGFEAPASHSARMRVLDEWPRQETASTVKDRRPARRISTENAPRSRHLGALPGTNHGHG